MTELEELKTKYPLAFDTIKLPVRYDNEGQLIFDANENMIADVRGWSYIESLPDPEQRQDQIGELICELINQLQ